MRFIAVAILASIISACGMGQHVSGGTDNSLSGEVTLVLKIDVSVCDGMSEEGKLTCIRSFLDSLKELSDLTKYLEVGK